MSPQASSILVDLRNAEVSMISACPPISNSSSPIIKPLAIVPSASITVGITVIFMFHNFFNSLVRPNYLFLVSFHLIFKLISTETAKSNTVGCIFFLLIIIWSGFLARIKLFVCILKSQRISCFSFSWTGAGPVKIVWSNFNFLHNSLWITFPTQLCPVLYSFCASLLHSFTTGLIVSFFSPHNLHLLFCCVLSIFALT